MNATQNNCENCGLKTKCGRSDKYFDLLLCAYCRSVLGTGENLRIPCGDTKLDRMVQEKIAERELQRRKCPKCYRRRVVCSIAKLLRFSCPDCLHTWMEQKCP